MTDHTDLIARLRDGIILHRWVTMKNEAADALEAQARTIDELRNALACEMDDTRNAIWPLNAEIERLRAERERDSWKREAELNAEAANQSADYAARLAITLELLRQHGIHVEKKWCWCEPIIEDHREGK